MRVKLKHFGVKARWVEVNTLQQASAVCQEYIAQYPLPADMWEGGDVKDADKTVAMVAYNGHVYPIKEWRKLVRSH